MSAPTPTAAALATAKARVAALDFKAREIVEAVTWSMALAIDKAASAATTRAAERCEEKARRMLACAEHGDARTCYELAAAIRGEGVEGGGRA